MEKGTYELSPKALEESPIDPIPNTARTSISTIADAEAEREKARHGNPNGFSRTENGIDVKAAEEEFATLQRELTGISQASKRLEKIQSRASGKGKGLGEKDVEKVASSDSGSSNVPFDLESTLRGNQNVSKPCVQRGP